jgi:DNA-binding CsgD family transcriptional regulator
VRARALHLLAEARTPDGPLASLPVLEEALVCAGDDARLAATLELGVALALMIVSDSVPAERHLDREVQLAGSVGETALLAQGIAFREAVRISAGRGVDIDALERALALEGPDNDVPFQLRPSMTVAAAYLFIGQIEAARRLLVGLRERIMARGEESALPFVLSYLAMTALLSGDFEVAAAEADDATRAAGLTGQVMFVAFGLATRAHARASSGDAAAARADGTEALAISERIGWPDGLSQSRWALGYLALSQGDPRDAVAALEPVVATAEAAGVYEWPVACFVPDAIEAFVATGELDRAERLTDALAQWGRRFARPWALALSGRCRALLHAAAGESASAQAAAERALVEHERLPMPLEVGRTLLILGQVQRRRGQRRAARESLERARALFEELGAPLWAEKARAEVGRIGVRRAPAELTKNEQMVAELAGNGLTNRDIAARMSLSRRTVEANLARAYQKLGIHSRAELGAAMAGRKQPPPSES